MPKALRRFLLALFAAAMQGAAQAEQVVLPGVHHEVDGATWTDSMVQELTAGCAALQPTHSAPAYCGSFSIKVRNETTDMLHCRTMLELNGTADGAPWSVEKDLVIEAGSERSTYSVNGPASSSPLSFSTDCRSVPAVAPALAGSSTCPVEVTVDNPDDFYPPGSIRRRESGEVIIDFTVEAGSARPKDIRLAQTSGWIDLDSAALKLARKFDISSQCGMQRVRRSIVFDISQDPRDTPEGFGCLVYSPPAMVLVTDPGSK